MCRACEELGDVAALNELASIAILDELEHIAELAGGFTIPDAVRDLLPHEKLAKVKFREMFDLMASGTADLNAAVASLAMIAHRELLKALAGADVLTAVGNLRANQPVAMAKAEAATALQIEGILARLCKKASENVIAEVRRQGISTAGLKPMIPVADSFFPMAMSLAMAPWTELLAEFQMAVFSPSAEVSELAKGRKAPISKAVPLPKHLVSAADNALAKVMGKLSDVAKQDIHIAHGRGRIRTGETLAPGSIFASEILDGATCARCETVDGKEYPTFAAARKDYPEAGYVNCLGGARCRGTLVFLYSEPEQ